MTLYQAGFLFKFNVSRPPVFTPKTPKTPKPMIHSPLTPNVEKLSTSNVEKPALPKTDVWTSWWCELRGTVLKCWAIDATVLLSGACIYKTTEDDEIRAIKAKQTMPNFIQLADACVAVKQKDPVPPSPYAQVPDVVLQDVSTFDPFCHAFKVNSSGQNLHTFLAPSLHFRDAWVAAIRIAQWENCIVNLEATRQLVASAEAPPAKQGWILARPNHETEWRRFWIAVEKDRVAFYSQVPEGKEPVVAIDGCTLVHVTDWTDDLMGARIAKIEGKICVKWDLLRPTFTPKSPNPWINSLPDAAYVLVMFPGTQDLVEFIHTTLDVWPRLKAGLERAQTLTAKDTKGAWLSVAECIASAEGQHTDPNVVLAHKQTMQGEALETWQHACTEKFEAWMMERDAVNGVSVMVLPSIPDIIVDSAHVTHDAPVTENQDAPLTVGQLLMQEANGTGLNQPEIVVTESGIPMAIPATLGDNVVAIPSPVVEIESGETVGVALQLVSLPTSQAPAQPNDGPPVCEPAQEKTEQASASTDSNSDQGSRSSRSTLKSRASSLRIQVPSKVALLPVVPLPTIAEDDDDKPLNQVARALDAKVDDKPMGQFMVQTSNGMFPITMDMSMGPPVFVSSHAVPQIVQHQVIPNLMRMPSRASNVSLSTIPVAFTPSTNMTDPLDFDDNASTRARKLLAAAWLEREREKERQRQRERMMERMRNGSLQPVSMQSMMHQPMQQQLLQQQMMQQQMMQQQLMMQQQMMQQQAMAMGGLVMLPPLPSLQSMSSLQSMQSIPGMQSMQSIPGMQSMQSIPAMQSIPGMQAMPGMMMGMPVMMKMPSQANR